MKTTSKAFTFITLIALSFNLMARDSQDNQSLIKHLPDFYPEITEVISAQGLESAGNSYAEALSSERPSGLSSIPNNPLSDEDSKYLKTLQIYNTQKLLELDALPLIFEMLTQAINEKNSQKIGFWTVCLNNNISTYTDLESFAEVSYFNRYIPAVFPDLKTVENKTISMRGSCTSSFEDALENTSGKKEFDRLRALRQAKIISTVPETVQEFLLQRPSHLLLASQAHANYFVQNLQRHAIHRDKTTHNGHLAVIKAAVDSISTTASILKTAKAFADSKTTYKSPSTKDIGIYKKAKVKASPLDTSLLLKDLVSKQDTSATIGLMTERLTTSHSPLLGRQSHLFVSLIANSLIENERAYRILDVEDTYNNDKLPAPEEMPLIIIPSSDYMFRSGWLISKKLEVKFQDYLNAGGKIIWLGSDIARFLHADLSINMTPIKQEITLDSGNKAEISDLTNDGNAITIDMMRVPSSFNKIIKPGLIIKNSEKLIPLLNFNDSNSVRTVAATTKDFKATYMNPLFFYPAAIEENYKELIPCKASKELSAFFNSALNRILAKK